MLQTNTTSLSKVSFLVDVEYDPKETSPEAMVLKLSDSLTFVEGVGQVNVYDSLVNTEPAS